MIYYAGKMNKGSWFITDNLKDFLKNPSHYEPHFMVKVDKLTLEQKNNLDSRGWTFYDLLHTNISR